MKLLLALIGSVIFPTAAVAEVVTYFCQFEYRIDETGRTAEQFTLEFKVDTNSGRAVMEGNVGLVDVEIYVGESAFSFIEKTLSGAVQTTTIRSDGVAVHSRNTFILAEFVTAQHFGICALS